MSRSRRKSPFVGVTTATSDKPWKLAEHQRERHHARQRLAVTGDDADPRMHGRPFGNPWAAPKDGRQRVAATSRWMRK